MIQATEVHEEKFTLMPVALFFHHQQFYIRIPDGFSELEAKEFTDRADKALRVIQNDPRNVTF